MRNLRRQRSTIWRGPAAVLGALALSTTLACTGSGDQDGPRAGRRGGGPGGPDGSGPPPVEAVLARGGALPLQETLSGVVRAHNQVAIRPEIEAPVTAVLVRSGDTVSRGQALVRLEDDQLRERLRQAEADVALARGSAAEARAGVAELEAQAGRTRRLAEENLVPVMDLETLEARLDAARAQATQAEARVQQALATLEERRNALSKAVVRAPVSGRVGRRNAEVGMLANTSTILFRIGDFEELIVEVPLTEGMLRFIEAGMPVRVHTGGRSAPGGVASAPTEAPIEANLSRISPFLEQGSFSTLGEIDLRNEEGRLRPGMFVTVDILYGESERATLVPAAALWEDPRSGAEGIYVVDGAIQATPPGGTARLSEEAFGVELRPVEVLAEGQGTLGVRGVDDGEWVVTVGQHLLATEAASEEGGPVTARVRPTTWDAVLELQGLQREDLLHGFLDKQRRLARQLGIDLPAADEDVNAPSDPTGPSGVAPVAGQTPATTAVAPTPTANKEI